MSPTEDHRPASTPSANGSASADDPRVVAALEEYVAALEAGHRPDRADFLARYPDVAAALADCLGGLEFVCDAGPRLAQPEQPSADSPALPLGDFRILREVGRGGMGVVYEAEQLSLGRRVALKVLPFAATIDPRHLQRFKNEVQAAACLQHQHIVPVYFAGCERGVHYYAMQFVDGRTLADLIAELRRREGLDAAPPAAAGEAPGEPTAPYSPALPPRPPSATTAASAPSTVPSGRGREYYRQVARWGEQAAEALEHAHQTGVIHRDVKPGNLLVDGRGDLWVTDFGLAHLQTEASLTATGDLMGTLRYMSPEQALAKRVVIDHRTDIYSLGVTLYELLTLRPAFRGADRQELLRQIAFEEPVKPRRLKRSVPAELETIVLKALEKNPADRYATAGELADDLRRWLEDRPIRARRPVLVQRAVKWARRHRPLVAAAVVVCVLAVCLLGVSTLVVWREKQNAERAHKKTKEALWRAQLHQNEVDTLVARLSESNKDSQARLERSLEAVGQIVGQLEEPPPGMAPELQQARQAVYEQALKFYRDVLPADRARPDYRWATAEFQDAPPLEGNYPASLRWEMMWAYISRGSLHALRNEFDEARRAYTRARRIAGAFRGILLPLTPGEKKELHLAALSAVQDRPSVEKVYRRALAHWRKTSPRGLHKFVDYRVELARLEPQFINRAVNAEEVYRKQIEVVERVAEDLRHYSAGGYWANYGDYLKEAGRRADAKAAYRRALELGERRAGGLLPEERRVGDRETFAEGERFLRLGDALLAVGESADAQRAIRTGLILCNQAPGYDALIYESSSSRHDYLMVPEFHDLAGRHHWCQGRPEEAIAEYREAIRLRKDFAEAHNDLGGQLLVISRRDEAITEFREAIRLKKDFAEAHCNLGLALLGKGQFRQAVEEIHRGHQLGSRSPGWRYPSAQWLRDAERMADVDARLPRLLKGEEQPADTAERLAAALCLQLRKLFAASARWYGEAFAADPKLAADPATGHRYNAACSAARAGCGQGKDVDKLDAKERARLRRQAQDWLRADLTAWRGLLRPKGTSGHHPVIVQKLVHWQQDPDFAGVRGPEALARLPEVERQAWRTLWADVADTLATARQLSERQAHAAVIIKAN